MKMIKALVAMLLCFAVSVAQADSPRYTISPSAFVLGKTYTITIQDTKCVGDDADLSKAKIVAIGSGITITPPNPVPAHKCDWTGTLTVGPDAETGDFKVEVQSATASSLTGISISAKAPGPIPPGLRPTVDVAWGVLPKRIASDNFGGRVTKLYYPIQVVIGNNSGYDLQLASIQFKLPDAAMLDSNVPTDSYYVVRSSLQREQLIGARNTTVNVIKAIGPILTGSTVFFDGSTAAALNHRSFFQGFTNIFSNPFEKGIEMVFPDQTVQQLINLDNHTLRDGIIIANNTQVRTIVFVNKDFLIRSVAKRTSVPNHVATRTRDTDDKVPDKNGSTERTDAADPAEAKALGGGGRFGKHEYDQQEVMRQLGSLQLVGRSIAYLNRVSVISNPPGPGPQFTLSPTSVTQAPSGNDAIALTLTGDGLSGGTLTASSKDLVISNQKVGDGGKSFTATLDASKAAPGMYTLTLTTSSSQSAQFEVKPAPISIDATQTPAISVKAGDPAAPFTVTGSYLKNVVRVDPDQKCVGTNVTILDKDPVSDDTHLRISVSATSQAQANPNCKATVTGKSGTTQTFTYAVTK